MLKIYGFDPSTWTNAARFTANALGLDYQYERVNLVTGEGQRPEYLALHPAGKVPAMDDDGFSLFESGAIQRYLAGKAGSRLYPSDLEDRALVDQWQLFAANHIGNAMGKLLFNRVIHKFFEAPSNQKEIEEAEGFLDRFLPIIDAQLGKTKYLASDELSIADLMLLAWLDPAELVGFDLSNYGNIVKWRKDLKSRDLYTACHRDYKEMFEGLIAQQQQSEIDPKSATA
jgi:glutathione S-transferase